MRLRERLSLEPAALLARALVVGLLGGGAALVLRWAATELPRLTWPGPELLTLAVAAAPPARRLVVPVVFSLLAGLVLSVGARWSGAARGWDILEAVVLRNGVLPLRPTLVRAASSVLTQAAAGAVGREGPIVLVSAAAASGLGRRLSLPTRHLRVLVGCGIAAGFACAYNTPIGAALFTMEVIFGSFTLEVFAPLVVSSVTATLLTWATFGQEPVFQVPRLTMASPWEILLFAGLGLLGGVVAATFLFALRGSAALYRRLRLPRPIAMALAGLVLGVAVLGFPEIVGNGREAIAALFLRSWGLSYVLALLALRLVVTPLMVGSGAVGGVFTPTLFLGAMLGQAFGTVVAQGLPALGTDPRAYALVGMACLLAGTTHAPLTAVLMVFEMTLDYQIVVPLLLASAVASLVATALGRDSVYTEALRRKAEAGEGPGPSAVDALHVSDLMRQEQVTVPPDLTLPRLLDTFVAARRNHLYVVDGGGRFLGAVNLHDVNHELRAGGGESGLVARDLARSRFETTTPDESLLHVLDRFAAQECERLPVVADAGSRHLVGTISKRDILSVYSLDLVQRGPAPHGAATVAAPVERFVEEVPVPPDLVGSTLAESWLSDERGISVLMIRRATAGLFIPEGRTRFLPGDQLVVFGPRERLASLRRRPTPTRGAEPRPGPGGPPAGPGGSRPRDR
jgi:CIC family chloride channel protein